MAVARLVKLLIASHKSEESKVLKALQKKAVAEIKPYNPQESNLSQPESAMENFRNVENVKKSLEVLNNHKDKIAKKIAAKAGKIMVKREDYEQISKRPDLEEIIEEILDYENELKTSDAKIAEIQNRIKYLKIWEPFKGNIEDLQGNDIYTIKLGFLRAKKNDFAKILLQLEQNGISSEIISKKGESNILIIAYHNASREQAEECIKSISFEEAVLKDYNKTIQENILSLNRSLEYNRHRKLSIIKLVRELDIKHSRDLTIYLDFLENNFEVEKAINCSLSTENASFYTAWVKAGDKNKVISELERFSSTKAYEIEPDEDEEFPVMLENKTIFKPFEIIINLYGVPKYFEIDPTPYVSLFFVLFFGLCLTDAGYGLIFVLLSFFLFYKLKGSKKMALLILFLGIFTILAGALFNGWFGDLPGYLGMEKIFSRFALFGDPMKSDAGAMNFFRLALVLGVVQVVFGLFIKLFDSIKRKNFAVAFLDTLPWLFIVISLVVMLLSTEMAVNMQLVDEPIFPSWISSILIWLLIPSALVIILFSARSQKSWGFRLFMGFLNLTIVNGITSFLGDFLSYIRLMALGLVTAGIGVAINKIVFDLYGIPYVGIVILVVGLIFGHIFNMGINILGGFVHTLRLQYVEFFSKFYEGGGRPFEELKEEHKYIILVD